MKSLLEKDQFIGLETCTWLYTGAETPPHKGCLQQVTEYFQYRALGPVGRERNALIEQECKRNVAALLQGREEQIAFLSNTSEAICAIAMALELQPGDNVVINTLEFPSGVLPWLLLKEKGVEVRVVEHRNWSVSAEDIAARIDDRTRLVVTSHVSYLTGARLDYKRLYRYVKSTNALLLLDVTQSFGAVPVDMNEADFVVCSSYKWLMSIHGLGILAVNPARTGDLRPRSVGWRSVRDMFSDDRFQTFDFYGDAKKFELGYPSYTAIYALHCTTSLLRQIGTERIEAHILRLGGVLIDKLAEAGFTVMTPGQPENRAGNICIVHPDGERVAHRLQQDNVYLWGGDGRVRASVHLFNDSDDIETFAGRLTEHKTTSKEIRR